MKKALFLIISLTFLTFPIFAQSQKFAIQLTVKSEDEDTQKEVSSYLSRELRSLGDVEIKDVALIQINVTAIKAKIASGQHFGYVLNYRVVEAVSCGEKVYFNLVGTGIYLDGTKELRSMCESLVTDFDTAFLEKRRKELKQSSPKTPS